MSGHSHFKTVAATKNANDAKRGKIFSKLGRVITIAVKEKGPDPTINTTLRAAMEQAKQFNMPKENVERAIKKGTGELAGENLEEVSFECFGPGGIAVIVDGITDNKNRTLGELKIILNRNNGKMAGEGAVRWMFERKGTITVNDENKTKEELEMLAIEAGAQDIKWNEKTLNIYTNPQDFEKIKKYLEDKNIKIEDSSLELTPKEEVSVSDKEKKQAQKLFEELDENDAIQDIYSNLKN